jgi:hypothetical protein
VVFTENLSISVEAFLKERIDERKQSSILSQLAIQLEKSK